MWMTGECPTRDIVYEGAIKFNNWLNQIPGSASVSPCMRIVIEHDEILAGDNAGKCSVCGEIVNKGKQ